MEPTLSQVVAVVAIGLAVYATFAERRRLRRRDFDRPGFMPWTPIVAISSLVGLIALVFVVYGR